MKNGNLFDKTAEYINQMNVFDWNVLIKFLKMEGLLLEEANGNLYLQTINQYRTQLIKCKYIEKTEHRNAYKRLKKIDLKAGELKDLYISSRKKKC